MKIVIETIPHAKQRYPTTGDWLFTHDATEGVYAKCNPVTLDPARETLHITVSAMGDWRYEALVGIHEVVEALLCRKAGIDETRVSRFDAIYECLREVVDAKNARSKHLRFEYRRLLAKEFNCFCTPTDTSEPGDDEHAPYYREHQLATSVERMVAAELGVSWNAYEKANLDLYETTPASRDS